MASADADALALDLPTDEELFLLQIEVADLQSQLDIIQARIGALTEQLNISSSQTRILNQLQKASAVPLARSADAKASAVPLVLLSAPTNEDAFKLWEAAGLQDGLQLENGLRTLEEWIFSQPNWQTLTREGWIQFVYTIFGESLDKLLGTG